MQGVDKPVGTNLTRIGEKARKDPKLVFTSLYHHITDIDNLRASYDKLLAHKASGTRCEPNEGANTANNSKRTFGTYRRV